MVLEGEMSFARMSEDETVEWIECSAGDSVIAPANAPHTFHNRGTQIARFLSVSTYYHETMFISGAVSVGADAPPPANLPPDVFQKFVIASEQAQVFVVSPQSEEQELIHD